MEIISAGATNPEDDFDIRDFYPAQVASAMRAGWADPEMDDYDNYDEAYRTASQRNHRAGSFGSRGNPRSPTRRRSLLASSSIKSRFSE